MFFSFSFVFVCFFVFCFFSSLFCFSAWFLPWGYSFHTGSWPSRVCLCQRQILAGLASKWWNWRLRVSLVQSHLRQTLRLAGKRGLCTCVVAEPSGSAFRQDPYLKPVGRAALVALEGDLWFRPNVIGQVALGWGSLCSQATLDTSPSRVLCALLFLVK